MKINIISNYSKANARSCTQEIVEYLTIRGCQSSLYEYDYAGNYPPNAFDCDFVLAIGGDGTIIHSAKAAARYQKEIVGVNVGSLGFTASMECREFSFLQQLLDGNYIHEHRMMIEAEIISSSGQKKLMALNDFVVSGGVSKIIDYQIALDNKSLYSYRADGFIISTPTGSTAYALSAGGPVIEPSMKCIEYTPICPHSLFNRSVIFNEDTVLYAWISEKNNSEVHISADGGKSEMFHFGDKIMFRKASYCAQFVRFENRNFYDVLNKKIISTRDDQIP